MRRSRKPVRAFRSCEGSNPSLSVRARYGRSPLSRRSRLLGHCPLGINAAQHESLRSLWPHCFPGTTMTAPRRRSSVAHRLPPRRRWRDYRTTSGRSPVEEFIDSLSDVDAASVLAGMAEVRDRGLTAAPDTWKATSGRYGSTVTASYTASYSLRKDHGAGCCSRSRGSRRKPKRLRARPSSLRSGDSVTGVAAALPNKRLKIGALSVDRVLGLYLH
jgi:hypothetical protein